MPVVWRLTPPAFARTLDGEGNRAVGARWNSPGRGVVYTCANLSLAVLETFVHIPPALRLSLPPFQAVCISVPDDAGKTEIPLATFKRLLAAANPQEACRAAGDGWLESTRDLVLVAPSVVVPEESNLMLNPAHPRMRDVKILSTRQFRFDSRLTASA